MISNEDLMDRINTLEDKVDMLCATMEQANGAWTFLKWVSTIALGLVVMWNGIAGWFK